MSKNKLIDPCIGLCKFDPVTGYCYGCACTLQDRHQWTNGAADTWKSKNLHDIKRRLSNSWPLNSWLTNYKYKQEKGESLFEVGEQTLGDTNHLKPSKPTQS